MKKNGLEWSVFGVGLILVGLLAGYLVREALTGPGLKAELRVRLGGPEKAGDVYRTRVTVENVGDESTRAIKVKIDDADLDLDYVPRRSTREGFVFTKEPPTKGEAVSWQAP